MENKFVKTLIEAIVKNRNMPKVQVEREISPILEIFIESAMNKLAENRKIKSGQYKLIASEFPISNWESENLRSINIDFLMFNESEKDLVFIELKTDSSSFETEQLKYYRDVVINNDPEKLYNFLEKLEHPKYINYKRIVDDKLTEFGIEKFENINQIEIIYIAPRHMGEINNHWGEERKEGIEFLQNGKFITFADLKKNNNIEHEFKEEWKIITEELEKLDEN
jgi:hypothetical protein